MLLYIIQEKQIHEDEEFSKTLSALDAPSPSSKGQPASSSRPPAKKLKLMMDRLPVRRSPSKTPTSTPTKEKPSKSCLSECQVWAKNVQRISFSILRTVSIVKG